jgi:hypothetical protein
VKRVIAVGLIVNAVLLAVVIGFLSKDGIEVVHAAGGVTVPIRNGDVNGDGSIDISDAIYLLASLFTGGPAPYQACDLSSLTTRIEELDAQLASAQADLAACRAHQGLPATGQSQIYVWHRADPSPFEVYCNLLDFPGVPCWVQIDWNSDPGAPYAWHGQDGFYQEGCGNSWRPPEGRFTDNGDGTVTDHCTGLMWQKDTGGTFAWPEALTYCENLSLAGHEDWRLPNVRELQSLVHYGRFQPAIHPVFSATTVSNWYWSSTVGVVDPRVPWIVDFSLGGILGNSTQSTGLGAAMYFHGLYVRAVRNAQ